MTTNTTTEHFHGPGVDARLSCEGEICTFAISVERQLVDADKPKVRLEVLLQPSNPESGLPYGIPVKLLNETVELFCSSSNHRAQGRTWLTGIAPDVAPYCYYRITTDGV